MDGAVWGHLVGDAVGVPYEFTTSDRIGLVEMRGGGVHRQPPGTWSDDGALMLALLDSLLSAGFDPEDQGRRFLAWRSGRGYTPDGDRPFDIGGATSEALDRIMAGTPAEQAGGTADRDSGNGSLMRILPIALVDPTAAPAEVVELAHRSSRVTHGHPRCLTACALYVLAAVELLRGERDRGGALERATALIGEDYARRTDAALSAALDELLGWRGRSGRGFVVDSFWSAWDAFAGARSYRHAIERAVRYGNDTDTTAAIAGGLAGLYWGVAGIPDEWLGAMRGREVVEPLIERLHQRVGRAATGPGG
jgi:ADP-ribosyl-[dinitrogen reductase] hydrolase